MVSPVFRIAGRDVLTLCSPNDRCGVSLLEFECAACRGPRRLGFTDQAFLEFRSLREHSHIVS
jgi:hypothetical protein